MVQAREVEVLQTKTCPCGAEFSFRASRKKPMYCSQACKAHFQNAEKHNGTTIACVVCGEEFYARQSRIDYGAKYCSTACKAKAETVLRRCAFCKQPAKIPPGRVYCSQQCYHDADRERRARERNERLVSVDQAHSQAYA